MGAGEEDVLAVLARERGGALLGYAMLVAGERAAAEDLVQEALVKVFSRLRQGFSPEDAERYVRRAILTTHLDAHRRTVRWRGVRHLSSRESPSYSPSSSLSSTARRESRSPRAGTRTTSPASSAGSRWTRLARSTSGRAPRGSWSP